MVTTQSHHKKLKKLTQLRDEKHLKNFKEKSYKNKGIDLPLHLCKLQLLVEIFVPGQFIPFHFGAGFEHVRVRVLCPSPHVTLHGPHDDHWLQLPFTDD